MLRIKGLTKRYRTGDLALKGIDMDVPDGQVMALIGPSGAGKSTVIRCINRLVEPTSGSIKLNDVDITKLGSAELRRVRRRMGMIFQEYALVERLSVMENVLTGRLGYVGFWRSWLRRFPQADIDEAFRLLQRVGRDPERRNAADLYPGDGGLGIQLHRHRRGHARGPGVHLGPPRDQRLHHRQAGRVAPARTFDDEGVERRESGFHALTTEADVWARAERKRIGWSVGVGAVLQEIRRDLVVAVGDGQRERGAAIDRRHRPASIP